ncbi:MAG: hypothetical protein H6981_11720 [Gammaproteobacteria bacterium]|nr:hypothetical protein [Gammaproteobacteria bacterium]MCP5137456.1 hypothetical protein [Gammaproteobacteria bacterium]
MNARLLAPIIALLVTPSAQAAIVFQDDFSDGDTVGWVFSGIDAGEWGASGGVLNSSIGADDAHDGSIGFALIDGVAASDHFRLSADVKVVQATGQGSDWGHVGLAWDVQDANHYTTSYLRTHWDHVTTWSVDPTSSGEYWLADPSGPTNGVFYAMSVEVDYLNQIFELTFNGLSATLSGTNFVTYMANAGVNSGGGIGLIQSGEEVHYDNVVYEDLTLANNHVPAPGSLALMLAAPMLRICARRSIRPALSRGGMVGVGRKAKTHERQENRENTGLPGYGELAIKQMNLRRISEITSKKRRECW